MAKKKTGSSKDVVKTDKKKKKKRDKDASPLSPKPQSTVSLMSTESKEKKKKKPKSTTNISDGKEKKRKKKRKSKSVEGEEGTSTHHSPSHNSHPEHRQLSTAGQDTAGYDATAGETSGHSPRKVPATGEDTGGGDSLIEDSPHGAVVGAAALGLDDQLSIAALDEADDDLGDMVSMKDEDYMKDGMDHMQGSQIIDMGPPIGEILAVESMDDDNVSDIGEVLPEEVNQEIIDGVQIIYNPDDTDVCFDDRGHPGTRDWILVIRETLEKFEGEDYSPPVYKAIKKKLKGRRFLVRARRNERTSWREATKPEVIEIFGDCFNEERRRRLEGMTDDDSGVDSSLVDSFVELSLAEESLSVGDIAIEQMPDISGHRASDKKKRSTPKSQTPTPKASNQQPPHDFEQSLVSSEEHMNKTSHSDGALTRHKGKMRGVKPTRSFNDDHNKKNGEPLTSQQYLLHAMREIEAAEEYARPFDKVSMMRKGIAAEEKLKLLLGLANSSKTIALKAELDKLEDLAERMKYASMEPLLEILIRIEERVTDYFLSLSQQNLDSNSLRASISKLKKSREKDFAKPSLKTQDSMERSPTNSARRRIDDDPETDLEHSNSRRTTERRDSSYSQQGVHKRSIPMNSDHGAPEINKKNDLSQVNEMNNSISMDGESVRSQELESDDDVQIDGDAELSEEEEELPGEDELRSVSNSRREAQIAAREADSDFASDMDEDPISNDGHSRDSYDDEVEEMEEELNDTDPHDRAKFDGEPSMRINELDGYKEIALGGSSGSYGYDLGSDNKESSSRRNNRRDGYDDSYGTQDLGGSFREEALGGSYGTYGQSQSMSQDLSRLSENSGDDDAEDSQRADEDEEQSLDQRELEDNYEREEEGKEGSFALRGEGDDVKNNGSVGAGGHVLELRSTPDGDEMSSVGRSIPDLYGSGSEGEDEEEYEYEYDEEEVYSDEDSDRSDSTASSEEASAPPNEEDTPNPKLEQFFDRLQHFFEVRRKVEERAEMMDPSMKFRTLKVKQHSGGLVKKNGRFKKELMQHDPRGKVVRNLDDLYDAAELALEEFKITVNLMAAEIKGMDESNVTVVPLKPRERAFEKAREEFADREPGPPDAWLFDIVRGSVVCKSYKQIADVNKWIGKNCNIITSKNRFSDPCFNGYRDFLYHVSIPYRDGQVHICEIQVHHKEMKALDEQFGMPKHYEYFRSAFAGPWRTQSQILDDLAMLNKYGEIGGQCMVKLLKSKDPDQLRLFAKLCRDKLDEFDRALELYRKILIMQEATKGDDHEDIASTYLCIGLVLGSLGEIDESLLNLQKALAIQESTLGNDHIQVAETYVELGHMLSQKGDYAEALKKYSAALSIREAQLGREHFLVINSIQDIGRVLRAQGNYRAAEAEIRRALKIQQVVLDDIHPDIATTYALLGETLCELGDFSRSMEENRMALSIRETSLGKNHQKTAESHTNIGIVLSQKGDYEVAEWRHRKALRIREAIKGKDDEECAISLSYLGEVLMKKGDYDAAVKELKRATKIRERNFGYDHPVTAGAYLKLGQVYLKRRKFDQALQEFRRAKVVRESFLGNRHPDTAEAYNGLGDALSLTGDHDAAIAEHKKAIKIYENVLGDSHPKTANGYQHLADSLLAKGKKDEALIQHRKALAVRANVLAKDHPATGLSCARIGGLLSGKGDLVGALVAYRQALAITVGLCGEDHPDAATAHIRVGAVLGAQEDFDEAMDEVVQGLAVRESILGKDHTETGKAFGTLGALYNLQGDFAKSQEYQKKALAILEKKLGKKSPDTKAARENLMRSVESKKVSLKKLLNC